ncbi:leucine-rich repeat domain-containing protein [Moraxella bovis]|uniref:Internalin-A n=1 Tax=Moraxella bovis TaxID=476 RepID=A0A378PSK1_MORBO|nr:leucine-rich repeat domain-containing protein [Moraxella bovis]STY91437.1 Internalin-A precursor [Moraxella bovis]
MSNLIPSQTALTLRRTDTLINLTNKLLAHTGGKGISEMNDDELWEWWLGIDNEWKFLLIRRGLKLKLWHNKDWKFNRAYHYQTEFDWLNRELVFGCLKALRKLVKINLENGKNQDLSVLTNLTQLTRLNLGNNQIQDISSLTHLTQLRFLNLNCNPIKSQDIKWLQKQLPDCEIIF